MRLSNLIADLVCLVTFATMGEYSHYGSVTVAGTAKILWPFVLAYALVVGVLLGLRRDTDLGRWSTGLLVALLSVALGLTLRVTLTIDTAQLPFVLVTLGVVTGLFVGYRILTNFMVSRVSPKP